MAAGSKSFASEESRDLGIKTQGHIFWRGAFALCKPGLKSAVSSEGKSWKTFVASSDVSGESEKRVMLIAKCETKKFGVWTVAVAFIVHNATYALAKLLSRFISAL